MVGPGEFQVQDGALVTRGGMGMLWYTREKLGNCQIRVVYKTLGPKDNSGVFVRFPNKPLDPFDAVNQGYEVQIANEGNEWHRTGTLYSLTQAITPVNPEPGEWATLLITLDGPRTRVEVNGKLVTDFREGDPVPDKKVWYEPERGPRPDYGFLGLQNHDQDSTVSFREISVRVLR